MTNYIYSRVSTEQQDTQNQVSALLEKYPNAEIVEEYASGVKSRPKLEQLLETMEKGDQLVVYALDRLGRSVKDVLNKIEIMNNKGIILVSQREGLDFNTPTGRFMMQVLLAFAELERNLISERTKTALKAVKGRGKVLGRPKNITEQEWSEAGLMRDAGKSLRDIEKKTRISKAALSKFFNK